MNQASTTAAFSANESWLKTYYFTRAAVAAAWVFLALNADQSGPLAAMLFVFYPLWDAVANLVDGARSGGISRNHTQQFNVIVSLAVAVGVYLALPDMHRVLSVFGVWAILSGVLQLGTGLRRRKQYGAQWAMILSGAQSALAGGVFIFQAQAAATPTVATVAGYAGFGAFYFLVSALSLSISGLRRDK
ncbi:tryptophan-rich sensory protein [Duganella sp. 1224]|uniref:DUF308 domain-containing protein n=1 Tax=Duganella sp. 1224 TaxID=2587052 RepID=UPI0015C97231|nr:DUF308 domain-containing protein [Duganella sp. 1224]NYE60794.1 tryptophan-rich sensory protein [Duganella sp. 1224]